MLTYDTYHEFRHALLVSRDHLHAGSGDDESLLEKTHWQLTTGAGRGGVPQLTKRFENDLHRSMTREARNQARAEGRARFRAVEAAIATMGAIGPAAAKLERVLRHFMSPAKERDENNLELAGELGVEERQLFEIRDKACLRAWRTYCRALALNENAEHGAFLRAN